MFHVKHTHAANFCRPRCAAPTGTALLLRLRPASARAPPAHLDSPDPALCPAPRAASQSSFSPSCPRLSRGRMFHVKHSSASGPRLRCPSHPSPARRVIPLPHPPSPVASPVYDPVFAMRVLALVPDPSHLLLSNPSAHAPLIPTPLRPPRPPASCALRVCAPCAARRSESAVLL